MSNLKIEESFEVQAPPDRVWAFLKDPAQVVTCLPGAALDEVIDDRNYAGNVKVKVGPVTVAYKGKATLNEVDEENRKVLIHGEGKEKAGGGNVSMDMTGTVVPTDGGSKVSFVADVKLAGKIVRFGRGMIEGVSDQLFKQFVEKARTVLETPVAEPAAAGAAEEGEGAAAPDSAPAPENKALTPPQEQEAVDGISLMFKVIWAGIAGFFRRLFGMKAEN